jgi:hypothetical protein
MPEDSPAQQSRHYHAGQNNNPIFQVDFHAHDSFA